MYHPLSLNGYSKIINAVKRQRNLGLSTDLKETIMGLDQEGYSACKIAEFLSLNRRTVSYIIKRYRERGTVENLPRSGRKKKTNVRTDRLLLRMVKTNRRQTLGDLTSKFNNSTPCKLSQEQSRGVYTMPDSKGEELRSLLRFEVSTKVRGERFADQNITGM